MATKEQQYTGRLYTQPEVDRMVREARERQIQWFIGTLEYNSQKDTIKLAELQLAELSKEDV